MRALPGVHGATAANGTLRLELAPGADARRDLSRALTAAGGVIVGMREPRASLEEAFITLTDDRVGTLVPEGR